MTKDKATQEREFVRWKESASPPPPAPMWDKEFYDMKEMEMRVIKHRAELDRITIRN